MNGFRGVEILVYLACIAGTIGSGLRLILYAIRKEWRKTK